MERGAGAGDGRQAFDASCELKKNNISMSLVLRREVGTLQVDGKQDGAMHTECERTVGNSA